MTKPRFRMALAAGVMASLLSVPVGAAAQTFTRTDRNTDGQVTYEEASRQIETLAAVHFRKFDRDRNGALSKVEYAAFSGFVDLMYED